MRQLPHSARDVRWYNSCPEISVLRPSHLREKRIRIRGEPYRRCFARRGHGGNPSTQPQRIVHIRDWPRIETRSLADDRARVVATGAYRMRTGKVRDLESHAGWPRRLASPYADHTHEAD